MAQGIVKVTPKGSQSGKVEITNNEGSRQVKTNAQLSYAQAGYAVGDQVNCTIDSTTSCTIVSKVGSK